jgi:hypothetical protein
MATWHALREVITSTGSARERWVVVCSWQLDSGGDTARCRASRARDADFHSSPSWMQG